MTLSPALAHHHELAQSVTCSWTHEHARRRACTSRLAYLHSVFRADMMLWIILTLSHLLTATNLLALGYHLVARPVGHLLLDPRARSQTSVSRLAYSVALNQLTGHSRIGLVMRTNASGATAVVHKYTRCSPCSPGPGSADTHWMCLLDRAQQRARRATSRLGSQTAIPNSPNA